MKDKKNNKETFVEIEEDIEPIEVISLDVDEEGEEPADLDAETTLDLLEDALEDNYSDRIAEDTEDEAVRESLMERQNLDAGREVLDEKLEEHHSETPELSGGDIDAAWDDADVGEETVGGTVATPDQDMVEEIGEAVGLTYDDDEPLDTEDKLEKR
ncbi:MAG: DUF6335 family protein, partial [Candidatus Promineifilaceae bacterium]